VHESGFWHIPSLADRRLSASCGYGASTSVAASLAHSGKAKACRSRQVLLSAPTVRGSLPGPVSGESCPRWRTRKCPKPDVFFERYFVDACALRLLSRPTERAQSVAPKARSASQRRTGSAFFGSQASMIRISGCSATVVSRDAHRDWTRLSMASSTSPSKR
jgi:hypothetical protein